MYEVTWRRKSVPGREGVFSCSGWGWPYKQNWVSDHGDWSWGRSCTNELTSHSADTRMPISHCCPDVATFHGSAGFVGAYSSQCNPEAASQHFGIGNDYISLHSPNAISFRGSNGVAGSYHNQHLLWCHLPEAQLYKPLRHLMPQSCWLRWLLPPLSSPCCPLPAQWSQHHHLLKPR